MYQKTIINIGRIYKTCSSLISFFGVFSVCFLLAMSGCKKDEELDIEVDPSNPLYGFSVDSTYFEFPLEGGSYELTISMKEEWEITPSQSDHSEWLSITPSKGEAGEDIKVTLTIGPNDFRHRGSNVKIKAGNVFMYLHVLQKGEIAGAEPISIEEVRNQYLEEVPYESDHYIEGYVVMSPIYKNIPEMELYVMDETGGITLLVEDALFINKRIPQGSKVRVFLKDLFYKEVDGLMKMGYKKTLSTFHIDVVDKKPEGTISPRDVTLDQVNEGLFQSEFVRISDMQFEDTTATYGVSNRLIDKDGKFIPLHTRKGSRFSNCRVPYGRGGFLGVITTVEGSPAVMVRDTIEAAQAMTGTRYITFRTFPLKGDFDVVKDTLNVMVRIPEGNDWEVQITEECDWLKVFKAEDGNSFNVIVSANPELKRSNSILIKSGEVSRVFPVFQKGENDIVYIYTPFELTEENCTTNAQEPSEGPLKNLFDGKNDTFFHSSWSVSVNETHYLQFDFKRPLTMVKFETVNRHNNGKNSPQIVDIQVSNDKEGWTSIKQLSEPGMTNVVSAVYSSPVINFKTPYRYMRYSVTKTHAGTKFFSLAEFRIYSVKVEVNE
ncbi:MAG: DUF5689 domain-containing protein [Bacteroidales bacterium]